jgi:O-antigen ligase
VVRYSYEDNPDLWASHNTYLDVGMLGGFPALVLYLIFLSKPLLRLWPWRADGFCLALIATYFGACVVLAGNSALQMKHTWMLWPLTMMAAMTLEGRRPAQAADAGRNRKNRWRKNNEQAPHRVNTM